MARWDMALMGFRNFAMYSTFFITNHRYIDLHRGGGRAKEKYKCIYIKVAKLYPKVRKLLANFLTALCNGRKMIVGRETGIFSFFSTTAVRAKIPQL